MASNCVMQLILVLGIFAFSAQAVNIVLSNDDGWAEINIRQFYSALSEAENSVVLSASAYNRSGTGSTDLPPLPLLTAGEFDSIPAGSPATGRNASMPRFHYVNSFPATAMRYGIERFSTEFFGRQPDLAVAGLNVGGNVGLVTQFSGTVGATVEAVKHGIPGIAFSGYTGDQTAWNISPVPHYSIIYATLSAQLTQALVSSGPPYLPPNVWLNVNLSETSTSLCSNPSDFKFVLTRINAALPFASKDVTTCESNRLPTEKNVVESGGCYVTISVGRADTKTDADAAAQAVVLKKLQSMLTCFST